MANGIAVVRVGCVCSFDARSLGRKGPRDVSSAADNNAPIECAAVDSSAASNAPTDNAAEAESLYTKLEGVILPMFYNDRAKFLEVMQHAIAINGSFFNTQRMVQQYITDAYLR